MVIEWRNDVTDTTEETERLCACETNVRSANDDHALLLIESGAHRRARNGKLTAACAYG